MLRIIFTLLFFFAVALLGIWINNHSFAIEAQFLNYRIETSAAKLSIVIFVLVSFFYSLFKLISWLRNSPVNFARKLKKDREKQAYRDLMQGFSALASADIPYAKKLADRSQKALEAEPLVKLLQAQIAVLSSKPFDAEKNYLELSKKEDSRIVGYRGLISQALASKDSERALQLAEELQKLNPNSPWANGASIDLAFRRRDWEKAEKYIEKAKKASVLTRDEANEKLAIVQFFYAQQALSSESYELAIDHLIKSQKLNAGFLPASILLAQLYMKTANQKAAEKLIEHCWKEQTHPQLAEIYEQLCSSLTSDKKLKKFEKLYKSNPQDDWRGRASAAKHEKAWVCQQTGAQYAQWQAYSSSGFFNTIVWDFPPQQAAFQNPMDSFLLIK